MSTAQHRAAPVPDNSILPGRRNGHRNNAFVWWSPFALVFAIIFFSPNFDSSTVVRHTPLGSDFLQDWIGAKIIISSARAKLYDADHFQAVQHDASLVGFSWPESQYYPMVYPPFYYSLLRPLAQLPYQTALWCWMLLLAAGLGATWVLIENIFPTGTMHGIYRMVGLFFPPLLMSLNMAHKSVFLLLIFTATFLQLRRNKPFSAGLVFGLVAFKPHLALLVGVVMLVKRQWWFVWGAALTVLILLISSLACGLDLCHDYALQSLAFGQYSQHEGYHLHEAVTWNAVSQLLVGGAGPLSYGIAVIASLATVATLILVWSGPIQTDSGRFAIQFALLMFAIPLLSPHFYIYDLTIMLLPFLLLIVPLFERIDHLFERRIQLDPYHAVLLVAIALFFLASGVFAPVAQATRIQPAAVLLMLLMGTLLLQQMRNAGQRPSAAR